MVSKKLRLKRAFRKKKDVIVEDDDDNELRRTASTSSYMQQRRNIYVNMKLPSSEYNEKGKRINAHYVSNRIRTAKYTPLTFVPKNLFEQFRNVANLYFLLLVVLQCIPIFGVVEPAVSALPLMAILLITAIKDGIEDWKRNQSDARVNNAKVQKLANWNNTNIEDNTNTRWHWLYVCIGFFCMLSGVENQYAHTYRMAITRKKPAKRKVKGRKTSSSRRSLTNESSIHTSHHHDHRQPLQQIDSDSSSLQPNAMPHHHTKQKNGSKKLLNTVRQRSDTFRSELSNMFKVQPRRPYRPGSIPHSVLYRTATGETASTRRASSVNPAGLPCADRAPGDSPAPKCKVFWQEVRWQDIMVGDYVMLRNNDDVPADMVILSTSETDNLCYIETQNLDGETNLKARQGLAATGDLKTVHDCERARFYIESEPPHANLYQYSGALRWDIEQPEENESTVSHQKTEAITYNNILLRGCVLRNTEWLIGVVVFTGDDTKIMLNQGKTPSKRSKIQKETNPHVIANFVVLAIICIVSSILDSVQFNDTGSAPFFDFNIRGDNATFDGFLTFWVTLILYQNIVPISLYISVEIVKTLAAYFIYADIDMYYEKTDTPCIPKTWNISDDLGQIEYIFSDKTGTLTQNVMEFRKCTIDGVSYGQGVTEAALGAQKRLQGNGEKNFVGTGHSSTDDTESGLSLPQSDLDEMEKIKKEMYEKQQTIFENTHVGPNPTFGDLQFFDDLRDRSGQHAMAMIHFMSALALCHTVIAERPDEENPEYIEYRATSPDEAALVATARDLGFVYLGRDANTLNVEVMGELKQFELLNTLEFNSTRKRMSVVLKPKDSDRIMLLCKGADSVIFERLCDDFGDQTELEKSQKQLQESTMQDLERFANEGLRTLCLAWRFISPEEYKVWNKSYQEACSSIYNREEKVDEVCEEIEVDMLLMGGTAIEDKLQDGVPETIAELAQSGIRLWVLTGDKTETAINIGFACNLITNDMRMIILKAEDRETTKKQLGDALQQVNNSDGQKIALVIDGTTLKYALEPATRETILRIGMKCASVVCCRVSPKQKAQVVTLVKKGLKVMTLAIGDGANDVSMIQEANVGIGISGVEGRQAVMASDYAIAQFRFLRKLLLVHGRWSYLRTAEMVMGFFYKNIVWTFVLFWYQIFCQWTGSMIFDYSLVTLYNLIFTSLPIIFMGIWDQDLSASTSLRYPELYRMGLRNDKFKVWRFWATIFDSIFQSTVCFFFPYMLLIDGNMDKAGYSVSNGVYEIGTVMSSIAVIVANLFVGFAIYSYTWIQVGIIALSILVYYAFVGIYAQFNTFIFAGHDRLFAVGYYWLILILTVVASFLPRVTVHYFLRIYYPYDNDIVREIELVPRSKGRRESLNGRETGESVKSTHE
ncbi:hypothetical protein BDA99DRAFT_557833 [Phascolomyces articulosus]|uniref:Phospholipid-transporting ATPase n=1 Tax=Phascolomyces articulosus TaxID=60185 RepID=A0AAD5K4N3_9FUNG|nr:hypothetical protein BDA99DRAFT_557833 [Phascolomyces articulosus]